MSVRQGTTRVMPIHNAPILMVDMSVNASLVLMEMASIAQVRKRLQLQ